MLLTALTVLALCACGESGSAGSKKGLQVGFGRADATPVDAVNISGGDSKNRISAGYRDPIMVACVAFGTGEDMSTPWITLRRPANILHLRKS